MKKLAENEGELVGAGALGAGSLGMAQLAAKNVPYQTPSFLDLGRQMWRGPEQQHITQRLRTTQAIKQRLAELAETSPMRFRLALAGMADLPGIDPKVLARVRKLTFNSPVSSELGDIVMRGHTKDMRGPMGAATRLLGGGEMQSANFDTGGKLPQFKRRVGSVIGILPADNRARRAEVFSYRPEEAAGWTDDISSVRLRPDISPTPADIQRAGPEIKSMLGREEAAYNAPLRRKVIGKEMGQELYAPYDKAMTGLVESGNHLKFMGVMRKLGLGQLGLKMLQPYKMRQGGEICTTSAAKSLQAVAPQFASAAETAAITPNEITRMAGGAAPRLRVAGMHLGKSLQTPFSLASNHLLKYAPTAARAGAAGLLGMPAAMLTARYVSQNAPSLPAASALARSPMQAAVSRFMPSVG
jgi:hypothetical protein